MASGGAFTGGWGGSIGAWAPQHLSNNEQQAAGDAGISKTSNPSAVHSQSSMHGEASTSVLVGGASSYGQGYAAAGHSTLTAKEAALARKEAELLARERDVANKEAELKRAGHMSPRKNWPVCFPLIHHDISGDIPRELQAQVRLAYLCYLGLVVCLLYNFVGACVMVGLGAPDRMSSWFLATIYCIAGIPLAMVFWYNKLYNTAANSGSLGYVGFFIGFCIHVAFSVWAAIAVPLAGERWSFTGWVAALRAFDVLAAAGIVYIIGSCLWTIEALASFWCLKMVYFSFRSGGKQQQVQGELSKVALKAAMGSNSRV